MTTITLKSGDSFYKMPLHEFVRYWLPQYDGGVIEVKGIPKNINPDALYMAIKRGKYAKRLYRSMNMKGSGKHDALAAHRNR